MTADYTERFAKAVEDLLDAKNAMDSLIDGEVDVTSAEYREAEIAMNAAWKQAQTLWFEWREARGA